MKNFFKLMGIIAMVAVIGFSMAACGDGGGDDGNGNGNGNGNNGGSVTWEQLKGTKWVQASTGYYVQFENAASAVGARIDYKKSGKTSTDDIKSFNGSKIVTTYNESFNVSISETTLTISNRSSDTVENGAYTKDSGNNGNNGNSGNFNFVTLDFYASTISRFSSQFSDYTGTSLVIHPGTQAEIEQKLTSISTDGGISRNCSFSDVEGRLKSGESWYKLTDADRAQILNQLQSKKYVLASKEMQTGYPKVCYIYDTTTSTWEPKH